MPRDDPDGTETRSGTERKQREDTQNHERLGGGPAKNDNPDGVPDNDNRKKR
jgi:hypothetical protein